MAAVLGRLGVLRYFPWIVPDNCVEFAPDADPDAPGIWEADEEVPDVEDASPPEEGGVGGVEGTGDGNVTATFSAGEPVAKVLPQVATLYPVITTGL